LKFKNWQTSFKRLLILLFHFSKIIFILGLTTVNGLMWYDFCHDGFSLLNYPIGSFVLTFLFLAFCVLFFLIIVIKINYYYFIKESLYQKAGLS